MWRLRCILRRHRILLTVNHQRVALWARTWIDAHLDQLCEKSNHVNIYWHVVDFCRSRTDVCGGSDSFLFVYSGVVWWRNRLKKKKVFSPQCLITLIIWTVWAKWLHVEDFQKESRVCLRLCWTLSHDHLKPDSDKLCSCCRTLVCL